MRGRRWIGLAAGVVLASAGLLVTGSPADAAKASNLPAGSTVCTDYAQSGNGMWISGFDGGSSRTWVLLRTTTPGGPETEVFRSTSGEFSGYVGIGQPGTYLYRGCVTVHSDGAIVRLNIGPMPPYVDASWDIGPSTAILGPGGKYCDDVSLGDRARIVGTASVPVQWYFNGFNEDYALVSNAWVGPVTASIDQVNTSTRKPVAELSACVSNVSSTPATVSFELSHP
jgi:hypothetical protein